MRISFYCGNMGMSHYGWYLLQEWTSIVQLFKGWFPRAIFWDQTEIDTWTSKSNISTRESTQILEN